MLPPKLLSCWDDGLQLTTASTAGDVSPTTNNAGQLRGGKRRGLNIPQKHVLKRQMFTGDFLLQEPTLMCWLWPRSDLRLASRSPGRGGWGMETFGI